jgi:hypothetical protein
MIVKVKARREANPVLVLLDLPGDTDTHDGHSFLAGPVDPIIMATGYAADAANGNV